MKANEAFISVFSKYADFLDVFLKNLVAKFQKYIKINNYTINLAKSQHSSYELIYNLDQIELKTLKIYIKTNIFNNFIMVYKSPIGISILFVNKFNSSLLFYVNYEGLNSRTIKNQYFLLLIGEFLDQLS